MAVELSALWHKCSENGFYKMWQSVLKTASTDFKTPGRSDTITTTKQLQPHFYYWIYPSHYRHPGISENTFKYIQPLHVVRFSSSLSFCLSDCNLASYIKKLFLSVFFIWACKTLLSHLSRAILPLSKILLFLFINLGHHGKGWGGQILYLNSQIFTAILVGVTSLFHLISPDNKIFKNICK